jgi:hypothetical protein
MAHLSKMCYINAFFVKIVIETDILFTLNFNAIIDIL